MQCLLKKLAFGRIVRVAEKDKHHISMTCFFSFKGTAILHLLSALLRSNTTSAAILNGY